MSVVDSAVLDCRQLLTLKEYVVDCISIRHADRARSLSKTVQDKRNGKLVKIHHCADEKHIFRYHFVNRLHGGSGYFSIIIVVLCVYDCKTPIPRTPP